MVTFQVSRSLVLTHTQVRLWLLVSLFYVLLAYIMDHTLGKFRHFSIAMGL